MFALCSFLCSVLQETPRPSNEPGINHQLAITNKLLAFGAAHKLDAAVDPAGNVRLRKAASPGFESATKIVVQSHMDVVCSKAQDKVHDFTRDPVTPIIEGNILRADRTTLGADDGIGVAAAMALLEETDPSFVHGPLEAVFTADEETTVSDSNNATRRPALLRVCSLLTLRRVCSVLFCRSLRWAAPRIWRRLPSCRAAF